MSECAKIASKKIEEEYLTIIRMFYDDYEPIVYNRGYGLYKSFKPYYHSGGRGNYSGGILISADRMKESDYTYKRNPNTDAGSSVGFMQKEIVLDVTIFHGFHGQPDIAVMSPSPIDMILKIRNQLASNPEEIVAQAWRNVITKYYSHITR